MALAVVYTMLSTTQTKYALYLSPLEVLLCPFSLNSPFSSLQEAKFSNFRYHRLVLLVLECRICCFVFVNWLLLFNTCI